MNSAPNSQLDPVERTNDGPLVFVVQNQHRYDAVKRTFVPKFDLDPARVFGDLIELLSPTASPFNFETVKEELIHKLSHYRDGDCLLCVGNPVLMMAAGAIAASFNEGRVRALQWSGKDQRYIPVDLSGLYEDND